MRLASLSQQTGSFKSLVPKGYNFSTIPTDLFNAIEQAFRILSWQENLGQDEMPPEWTWNLDWEIEAWFKKIKIDRERKWGNGSSPSADVAESDEMFDDNVYFDRIKNGESLFE